MSTASLGNIYKSMVFVYTMNEIKFDWDPVKNEQNIEKHHVSFYFAQKAFLDPKRIIAEDVNHSKHEKRHYCIGRVKDGIVTVRFTYRGYIIRIIGAGYWRKGKKLYEQENPLH